MGRRAPGVAISIALHLVCAAGAIVLVHARAVDHSTPTKSSLTFVNVALTPPPVTHAAALPPPPAPAPREIAAIDPPPPVMPKPAPVATPPPPVKEEAVVAEPPAPIAPPVEVVAANVQTPQEPVRVGAFGDATSARERSVDQRGVVVGAGFGDAAAKRMPHAVAASVVGSAGFDQHAATPPPVTVRPVVAVLDATAGAFDVPVEIVFKPTPRYTDEASALGIQGSVVLEVEFTATNDVRVVRVMRSLGHGLDEAAARAAEQIRFKPARRQGVPVDCRVTVQIDFRIT